MRDLYRQRLSRVLSSRIWTCRGCQQHRIRQFTMSNSPRQQEENFTGPLKQNAPLDDAAADGGETLRNKRQEPKRTHLKNSGQYFVTTPIFYVNGDPHVGHMHSMVLADVHKRYKALWGKSTLLSTGTDDHGMKVQKAALAQGQHPYLFCEAAAQKFQALANKINMSDHVFIRTVQEDHKKAVQHLWILLQSRDYIYKGTHEGWYSVTDECFYTKSQVEDRLDTNDMPYKVAKETGSIVEWSSEENYCFRLSKLQKRLQEYYEMYPTSIVPATQYQWVLKAVSSPLEDLSISRPRSRLSWGIEVPGDPEQTIYVWFDALVNYLTVTGYPWEDKAASGFETSLGDVSMQEEEIEPVATSSGGQTTNFVEGEPFMEGESSLVEGISAEVESSRDQTSEDGPLVLHTAWPADVHVIGKDIVRFHCIFWPAFLMAADIALPRQILVHSHWTVDGQKMSKSLGNVIAPSSVLENFPADVVRYYMIKEGGLERDGNWSNDSLRNRYVFLANTWGNLVSRMMSPKMDLRTAVTRCFGEGGEYRGVYSLKPEEDDRLRNAIETAVDVYRYNMNVLNFEAAISVLDNLMRATNMYVTTIAPWLYTAESLREQFYTVQYNVGEAVRITSIFAQPFMPVKAKEMLDILGVHPRKRDFRYALWGADKQYGRQRVQGGGPVHLFPRMKEDGSGPTEPMPQLMTRRRAQKLAARKEQGERARSGGGQGRQNQEQKPWASQGSVY